MAPLVNAIREIPAVAGTVVAVVLALLILVPYGLFPVLMKSMYRQRAEPRLEPFDPAVRPIPTDVAGHFSGSIEQLERLGFTLVEYAALPDQVPNTAGILAILENPAARDLALVVAVYAFTRDEGGSRNVQMRMRFVEFSCELSDGRSISTNNARMVAGTTLLPRREVHIFPGVEPLDRLYRLHQRAVEEAGHPSKDPLPPTDLLVDAVRDDMQAEMRELEAQGYLARRPDEDYYHPTWKGAFLLTWRELWPLRAIRAARTRRAAQRRAYEWGIDERD